MDVYLKKPVIESLVVNRNLNYDNEVPIEITTPTTSQFHHLKKAIVNTWNKKTNYLGLWHRFAKTKKTSDQFSKLFLIIKNFNKSV